ncbi:hypothetical protein F-liban_257 [Faustovirus]|nr:hypothetical protein F-liban_257 [Faustovirus]
MNTITIKSYDFVLVVNHIMSIDLSKKIDSKYVVFDSANVERIVNGVFTKLDKKIAINENSVSECIFDICDDKEAIIEVNIIKNNFDWVSCEIHPWFLALSNGDRFYVVGDKLHTYVVVSIDVLPVHPRSNSIRLFPLVKSMECITPPLVGDVTKRDEANKPKITVPEVKEEPQVIVPVQSALPPVAPESAPKDAVKAESVAAVSPLMKPIYAFEEASFHGLKVWKLTSHCNSYASVKISFGVVPADMKLINVSKVTNTITPIVVKKDMDHVMINPNTNSMFWFTNMTGSEMVTPDISDYELIPM